MPFSFQQETEYIIRCLVFATGSPPRPEVPEGWIVLDHQVRDLDSHSKVYFQNPSADHGLFIGLVAAAKSTAGWIHWDADAPEFEPALDDILYHLRQLENHLVLGDRDVPPSADA